MGVKNAINKIIEDIDNNPFIFRNEADIQARLYCKLCEEFNEWAPTHMTRFKELKTNLVHREYFGGGNQSVDLVILDESDVMNIRKNSMEKSQSKEYVRASDAIEIKTDLGYYHQRTVEGSHTDIDKLLALRKNNSAKNLHFILIIRWPPYSDEKQMIINRFVREIKNRCQENNINFYTNNKDNYFLKL